MSGGSKSALGQSLIKVGLNMGATVPTSNAPVYGASTPTRTTQDSVKYTPTYAQPPKQSTQQSVENTGLEALYQSIANQYAPISQQFNPMDQFYQQSEPQTMQRQMPTYQNPALNYRPDMASAMQKLTQVVPSVAELNRRQAIEDARIAAEQAANPEPTYYFGGNG